ncbi:MAG: hypothetical protein HY606_10905 [Planctomycetes bacterium]|nr:hypothetical protein [Planctomycetota bacterium]
MPLQYSTIMLRIIPAVLFCAGTLLSAESTDLSIQTTVYSDLETITVQYDDGNSSQYQTYRASGGRFLAGVEMMSPLDTLPLAYDGSEKASYSNQDSGSGSWSDDIHIWTILYEDGSFSPEFMAGLTRSLSSPEQSIYVPGVGWEVPMQE